MYFKIVSENYIVAIGQGESGEAISNAEYDEIANALRNIHREPGKGCRLKTDLTWEIYDLPPSPVEPITEEEALVRYSNEITGASDSTLQEATETLIKIVKEEN